MDAFSLLEATCLPFYQDDIDTDQIIPARFLKGTTKTGLGQQLFYDWRYDESGKLLPASLWDNPRYAGSKILISGHNFGCGSSREHAPWALRDFGFRAVLAVSFADIFYNNALKNSLLPIALPEAIVKNLIDRVIADPALTLKINLERQTVEVPEEGVFQFEINAFRKKCLLEGLDDIAYVLSYLPEIEAFEKAAR